MDTAVTFKTPIFEGPLDLLLFLISKNKVEITDIPVAEILEQYMEYLDRMATLDMEIASDFIVMAAQLILIKSRILLPKPEEEDDPREELVKSLIEYQRFKEASDFFKVRAERGYDLFIRQSEPLEKQNDYNYRHDTKELIRAIRMIKEREREMRPPSKESFAGIVGSEPVPVEEKVKELLKKLILTNSVEFKSVFCGAKSRSEIVAIFLAVLELLNTKRVQPVDEFGKCMLVLSAGSKTERE